MPKKIIAVSTNLNSKQAPKFLMQLFSFMLYFNYTLLLIITIFIIGATKNKKKKTK